MKNSVKILALIIAFFAAGNLFAQDSLQVQHQNKHQYKGQKMNTDQNMSKQFVDLNGDGYNDNAPDDDGDGIPNGQDPDYVRSTTSKAMQNGKGFIDADGDGINDNALDADGDGIPNGQDPDYVKPMDGTGAQHGKGLNANSAGALGTGDCTGTGTATTTTKASKKGGRK
ncbi:hypothetical protein LA303_05895 [Candidatus Sulfidibacterium hydrothermale]|uniref:hypothetical protein n=1 Tax=Candidatus Sulfidibacterium hydrothermale TaxID=2875962 RepID=UPI001F0B20AA|nr:hypothetical protein [Candidatus Sulfidibacterium hydrothermale]UBM63498.1 hypothetical protein LA303_05895 [Candidatus Sulfidibacterium hydrothermale]